MKCKKCTKNMPIGRFNLGYKVCTSCSTVEQVCCAPLINHKTGNTIQIVSKEQSIALIKAGRRKGYGTCLR